MSSAGEPSSETRRRKSIRLRGYDYAQAGAYFVTICAYQRACLFGDVVDGDVRLSALGIALQDEWLWTPVVRASVHLDAFVIMPNHFHGIILVDAVQGTARRAPTGERFAAPVMGSLPTIVRAFKSATTREVNRLRKTPGAPVWQRNYYEHVIRDDHDLERIRAYIFNNPSQWLIDVEYPA